MISSEIPTGEIVPVLTYGSSEASGVFMSRLNRGLMWYMPRDSCLRELRPDQEEKRNLLGGTRFIKRKCESNQF